MWPKTTRCTSYGSFCTPAGRTCMNTSSGSCRYCAIPEFFDLDPIDETPHARIEVNSFRQLFLHSALWHCHIYFARALAASKLLLAALTPQFLEILRGIGRADVHRV